MEALNIAETVFKSIDAIKVGPLALRVYLDACVKCGACAEQCPAFFGSEERKFNPSQRSDLIRRVYKRNQTFFGRMVRAATGNRGFREDEIHVWAKAFYQCTACRRCAVYCPFGIDNSVIVRKGRAILDQLGDACLIHIIRKRLLTLGVRGPRPSTRANFGGLTSREIEILGLLDEGLRNVDIAMRLHLSPKTVDHHVSSVISKLGVKTRGEAARVFRSQR